jgi:hypothetical protein
MPIDGREAVLWAGVVLLAVAFVVNAHRTVRLGREWVRHLEAHHAARDRRIYLDRWSTIALGPFARGSGVEFLWRSEEDLGDVKVAVLRVKIKHAFTVVVMTVLAMASWCALLRF